MMRNYHLAKLPFAVLLMLCLALSCKPDKKQDKKTEPKAELVYPSFNKDSAYAFIKTQLSFGPRIPNTQAHKDCAKWFVDKLRSYGLNVIEQRFQAKAYNGVMLNGVNVIGQINPAAKKRILLAAHWDTRPWSDKDPDVNKQKKSFDSADDGPSGVAVLIELARVFQSQPLKNIGIDIVFFDLEDYGEEHSEGKTNTENTWGLGSQYWSRNQNMGTAKPKYGILLDMVGGAYPNFYTEDFSLHFAKDVVEKVWSLAESEGYGNAFIRKSMGGVTDDHYFVNTIAKIPMIDIINRPAGKFPHYHHTQKDDINVIDPFTLQMVGKIMVKLIYREDAGAI